MQQGTPTGTERLAAALTSWRHRVRPGWTDDAPPRPWRALLACASRLVGIGARRASPRLGPTVLLLGEHTPGRIELQRGSVLQVCLQARARITCEVGQAWITRDDSSLDTVLTIGSSVEMQAGTRVFITAMPIAAVRLQHV